MAHFWVKDPQGSEDWAIVPLEGEAFELTWNCSSPVRVMGEEPRRDDGTFVFRKLRQNGEVWLLVCGAENGVSVRVGGLPVLAGICVIRDRSEIRIEGGAPMFFSKESLARVEEFPGADRPVICPRDKQEIRKGDMAVKCPNCHVWYHQTEDLPCWTYTEKCALCIQKTDLAEADYRWRPEDI